MLSARLLKSSLPVFTKSTNASSAFLNELASAPPTCWTQFMASPAYFVSESLTASQPTLVLSAASFAFPAAPSAAAPAVAFASAVLLASSVVPRIASRSAAQDSRAAPASLASSSTVKRTPSAARRAAAANSSNPRSGTSSGLSSKADTNALFATLPARAASPANLFSMRPMPISGISVTRRSMPSVSKPALRASSSLFMPRSEAFSIASTPAIRALAACKARSPMAAGSKPQIATTARNAP